MSADSDANHARRLIEQVSDAVHSHDLVEKATQLLCDRYHLPAEQARTFLQNKANDSYRDVADVAREVLDGRRRSLRDV